MQYAVFDSVPFEFAKTCGWLAGLQSPDAPAHGAGHAAAPASAEGLALVLIQLTVMIKYMHFTLRAGACLAGAMRSSFALRAPAVVTDWNCAQPRLG